MDILADTEDTGGDVANVDCTARTTVAINSAEGSWEEILVAALAAGWEVFSSPVVGGADEACE